MTTAVLVRLLPRAPTPSDDLGSEDRLVDRFGRVHRDLRISVTDRCNFRCVYCMPEEGLEFLPRSQILTYEEIARVARVAHRLGVRSVRITGGEPLVRRGIETSSSCSAGDRVRRPVHDDERDRLRPPGASGWPTPGCGGSTSAATRSSPTATAPIRRRGKLAAVLGAMDAAERAGLGPIKVNVVVMAGVNDDEIVDFARFARDTGAHRALHRVHAARRGRRWDRASVVPAAAILRGHRRALPARAAGRRRRRPDAPATRYRFADGVGEIGVIPTVTEPFCGTCDRLRLTADGAVRNCLFATEETPLRNLLRTGADDSAIALALRRAVNAKLPGTGSTTPGSSGRPARCR